MRPESRMTISFLRRTAVWVCMALAAGGAAPASQKGKITNGSSSTRREFILPGPEVSVRFQWLERIAYRNSNRIMRRRNGLLWMTAGSGLYSFDGYETRFYHEPWDAPNARVSNFLVCMAEDSNGVLWLGSRLGLKRFNDTTGALVRVTPDVRDPKGGGPWLTTALCADRRYLWVGTLRGLDRLDPTSGVFRHFRHDPQNPNSLVCDTVTALLLGRDASLWVATIQGLSLYDPESDSFTNYTDNSPPPFRLPKRSVQLLFQDREGRLWIGSKGFLTVFDFQRGRSTSYPARPDVPGRLPDSLVISMGQDGLGGLWIGTANRGLLRFLPDLGTFHEITPRTTEPAPSNSTAAGALWFEPRQDPSGHEPSIGWLISGERIWQVSVSKSPLRYFADPSSGEPISFAGGFWKMVLDRHHNLWAGQFNGGVIRIDLKSRCYTFFRPGEPSGITGRASAYWVTLDRGGTVWAWTPGLLYRYREDRHRFETIADSVMAEIETRDARRWAVTMSPDTIPVLALINPETGSLSPFLRRPADFEGRAVSHVNAIFEDHYGEIWFGTFGEGLYRFSPSTGEYRHYTARPNVPGTLKTSTVTCLLEDPSGTLWVGTHSGLHHFDREKEIFVHHPMTGHEEELGHFIRGMMLDSSGTLWIGDDLGIARFDITRRAFRDIYAEGGAEIRRPTCFAFDPSTGWIYVGNTYGRLAAFQPNEMPEVGTAGMPDVVLTDFRVFEKSVPLSAPLSTLKEISLDYNQNYFSFTYSALEFLRIEKIAYAHMMEGFDHDWINTGPRAYAGYTNLDPGDYVFHVKSTNVAGIWNDRSTAIRVRILPPWWRTTWAYILFTMAFALLVYGARRFEKRRVHLKHELRMMDFEAKKLHEVDQMKTRFFANISHEFRTPLSLILGPVEKLSQRLGTTENANDLAMIHRNARRLLRLVNQILDLSRLDAGRMLLQASPTDLVAFLRPHVQAFSSLAASRQITLIFDPEDDSIVIYADRDKLEKIVSNLLSNALKFTQAGGEVVVTASVRDQDGKPIDPNRSAAARWVEIAVSDSGIGIPPEKIHKVFDRYYQVEDAQTHSRGGAGIGLSLTRELVMLHHGEIFVRSMPGEGTTFTLRLPTGTAHLQPGEIIDHAVTPGGLITPVEIIPESPEGAPEHSGPDRGPDETRPRILIVEDNQDVRTYLRNYLEPEYSVDEAPDGRAGFERAVAEIPDLVISDIMMPVMDGIEMCKRLKQDDRTSHIPVVLLTARADDASKFQGLETGADEYLVKPLEAKELRVRAKNLIDLRRILRDKYRRHVVLEPAAIPIASADERFLKKIMETIQYHMADPSLDTEALAKEMCMSRMQLNRKLNALTGHSTHEFLRTQRLQRAARLLTAHSGNVTEVAYEVGFSSLSHFAKAFKEELGVPPHEYAAQQHSAE